MKIGIITLHRAHNYGAVLQCYALQKVLEGMGHDVRIIDFAPYEVYGYYDYRIFSKPRSVQSILSKTLRYLSNKKRSKSFNAFMDKHLHLTRYFEYVEELEAASFGFDAVVCGSDQIWNVNIVAPVMGAYFLAFVDDESKKIAYGASYGEMKPIFSCKEEIKRYLASFDAVSLREDEGIALTEALWGKEAQCVPDPSMLLKTKDYRSLAKPLLVPHKYLLVYMLSKNKSMACHVRYLAAKLGLPVMNLGRRIYGLPRGSKHLKSIGPGEFIYLMEHAQCVCTNSFHGTCFSILYNKPFVTFATKRRNARLVTLLKNHNLEERMVWGDDVCHDKVYKNLKNKCRSSSLELEIQRKIAFNFIKTALK